MINSHTPHDTWKLNPELLVLKVTEVTGHTNRVESIIKSLYHHTLQILSCNVWEEENKWKLNSVQKE